MSGIRSAFLILGIGSLPACAISGVPVTLRDASPNLAAYEGGAYDPHLDTEVSVVCKVTKDDIEAALQKRPVDSKCSSNLNEYDVFFLQTRLVVMTIGFTKNVLAEYNRNRAAGKNADMEKKALADAVAALTVSGVRVYALVKLAPVLSRRVKQDFSGMNMLKGMSVAKALTGAQTELANASTEIPGLIKELRTAAPDLADDFKNAFDKAKSGA